MNLSSNGLQQIIAREGVILHAYKDSVGVWTIGTGHTSAAGPPTVTPGMVITNQQNEQILRQDLAPIITQVNNALKVKVTQNQFDAIVSIVFNVGPRFLKSASIARLNQGDVQGAATAIMQWSKPPEIIGRRRTEQKQFLTPDSPSITQHATAGAVIAAGGVAASTAPHHLWPWILGGAAALAVIVWLAIYLYKRNQTQ